LHARLENKFGQIVFNVRQTNLVLMNLFNAEPGIFAKNTAILL